MFRNAKLRKALIGAGLGVLGACAVAGGTWLTIDRIVSQKQNVDTGFDADNENHDYGETVDLPQNIVFKRNVAGQAATLNVRAKVLPDTVLNKKLTWKLEWVSSSVVLNVADYVTVTPSEDTLSAVITLKTAFRLPINLVVISQQDSSKQATCRLDYNYRLEIVREDCFVAGVYSDEESLASFDDDFISLDTVFNGKNLDEIYNKQGVHRDEVLCAPEIGALDFIGTTGSVKFNMYVKVDFDDKYKSAMASITGLRENWDSSEWRDYSDFIDKGFTEGLNPEGNTNTIYSGSTVYPGGITVYSFENATTQTGSVKGYYGAIEGTFTISIKITDTYGFEKIISTTFGNADIPSLTNVTGIQLDNSTYVF